MTRVTPEEFEKKVLKKCSELDITCIPNPQLDTIGAMEILKDGELICVVEFGKSREFVEWFEKVATEEEGEKLDEYLDRVLREEKLHCEYDKYMYGKCRHNLGYNVGTIAKQVCQHVKIFKELKPYKKSFEIANFLSDSKNVEHEVNNFMLLIWKLAIEKASPYEFIRVLQEFLERINSCVITNSYENCKRAISNANIHGELKQFMLNVLETLKKTYESKIDVCECCDLVGTHLRSLFGEFIDTLAKYIKNVSGL